MLVFGALFVVIDLIFTKTIPLKMINTDNKSNIPKLSLSLSPQKIATTGIRYVIDAVSITPDTFINQLNNNNAKAEPKTANSPTYNNPFIASLSLIIVVVKFVDVSMKIVRGINIITKATEVIVNGSI